MKAWISDQLRHYYNDNPINLVDIGAAGGIAARWKRAQEVLRVISFEPEKSAYLELTKMKSANGDICFNKALYKNNSKIKLYITRKRQCSSVYEPNSAFLNQFPGSERFSVVNTEDIEVDTLDSLEVERTIGDVDFIKIDTQGSELDILKGGEETLRKVFGLQLEIEFEKMYKNQPLFNQVDEFIRERGFILFDLEKTYWKRNDGVHYGGKKGQLIAGDALYFRDVENFGKLIENYTPHEKKTKLLKAMSVVILYGYLDYCIELFNNFSSLFSSDEKTAFKSSLKEEYKPMKVFPFFSGRDRLRRVLLRLLDYLDPNSYRHISGDGRLGN